MSARHCRLLVDGSSELLTEMLWPRHLLYYWHSPLPLLDDHFLGRRRRERRARMIEVPTAARRASHRRKVRTQ